MDRFKVKPKGELEYFFDWIFQTIQYLFVACVLFTYTLMGACFIGIVCVFINGFINKTSF